MKTQLYKYDGTPLFEVIVDDTSTQDWSLMSDNKLSVSFELEECVVLTAGCYIDFDSTRFYLLNEYKPTMICSSVWKYDLTLGDAASWLSITLALKTIDGENTPLFKYTAPAAEHAAIIVANLNRRMGTDQWKVGSVISTENIAIDYSGKYCSDVLQEIVDAKNTEWWIDGMTLNIGRAEFGERVTLGYMNGALGDIVCDTAGDMRSYAYLFPIGSTRNIDPTKYGHDRLQLPSGLKSVPINPEQGVAELVEEAAFAHIYPRYEGTVSAVRYAKATNADGTPFLIYYIKDTAIPFNPNEFEITGLVKHITFQSGELMGQEFEVNYSADSNEFELITRWTGDIQLPGGVLVPAVGDKYVVWNISMPDVYYTIASHELLDAARAYAADAIKDVSVYKVKLDYVDVQERGLKLRPGQRVRLLSDMYFASGYYDSRITRITRNIAYPDALSVDISAVRVVGTLSRLQASIQKTENVVAQFSGQLPAIIKSNDDTSADDSSVYTSAKSEKEFLNKRKGGEVAAPVTFDEVAEFLNGLVAHKYIKIGNGYLRYNDELGVWEMVGDLLVTGAVTMFGSLSGFKPSTIMDAVQVDNETIIKVKDAQGNWVLRALGGGGSGGTGGSLTAAEVNVLISEYLTKNSYATQGWVGDNYLSKSGGAIRGTEETVLKINTSYAVGVAVNFRVGDKSRAWVGYNTSDGAYLGDADWGYTIRIGTDGKPYYRSYELIHSNNIGQYAYIRDYGSIPNGEDLANLQAGSYWVHENLGASSAVKLSYSSLVVLGNSYYSPQMNISHNAQQAYIRGVYNTGSGNSVSNWHELAFTDSNVASATKLQTPRTIWGQSFDGTGNISGMLTNVDGIQGSTIDGCYIGDRNKGLGVTDGGSMIYNYSSAPIAFYINGSEYMRIISGGNVAIGSTTADYKLYVHGVGGFKDGLWAQGIRLENTDEINSYGSMGGTGNGHLYLNFRSSGYVILAKGGGYVGIGSTVAEAKLHVHGDAKINTSLTVATNVQIPANGDRITFNSVSGTYTKGVLAMNANNTYFEAPLSSDSKTASKPPIMIGWTDGTYPIYINSKANVAIGGTTADAKLHIHGTNVVSDVNASGLLLVGESGGTHLAIDGNDIQAKSNANTLSTLYLNGWGGNVIINESNAGKVGIGTPNPTVKFHIHYSSGANGMTISRDGDECSIGYVSTANSAFVAGVWGNSFNIWNEDYGTIASFYDGGAKINGDLLTTGAITMFSQLSMKNVIDYDGLSLAQLAQIRPARFTWKDGRDNRTHVGGIADYIQPILPEVVYETVNKELTVDYGSAAFYIGASLIKPVIDHERRIADLERENKQLKQQLGRLSAA